MQFCILGPLEVCDDGRAVTLGGPKQRAVLAALLLDANRVVALDRLVDALWGERPPPTAATTVQVYVSQLRRLVGRERLVTRPPGYLLELGVDELDYTTFRRLVRRARRAADPAEEAGLLREALELWRGDPFADIAYEPFARTAAARLEEERLAALEERIDADLALGGVSELVPELEELVAGEPLRERFRGQLMLALYRSGRQADALAFYRETRRVLDAELGLAPGAELQRLERQILTHDPSLDAVARSRRPPGRDLDAGRAERRTITVLYAAVAGATADLDPEDIRPLLLRVQPQLRAELERFGAAVEPVAGTALMAVFGAPVLHEDDAERAVRAALAARDIVALVGAEDPQPGLDLRVGIDTGRALVDHHSLTGNVVNTAVRLHAAAPVGGILVGDATRRATAEAIEYRRARGAWEPVRVKLAVGERRVPQRSPLVGRAAELGLLRAEVERLRLERAPRAVTLVGPPGIGKTRLVAELQAAEHDDVKWLLGRSLSYGDGVPFHALREIVRARIGLVDGDEPGAAAEKLGRALPASLAETRGWVESHVRLLVGLESEAVGDRREAFAGWRRFLEALADDEPIALVLEDVHWADDGLLDFVESLRVWAAAPLLVVCTGRPELLERRPDWPALQLAPLSDNASAQLLHVATGGVELDRGVREAVLARAGGNPLFVEEFARTLAAEGNAPALPSTVHDVIAARLDGLPPDEKTLVADAAVVGKTFWPGALAAVGRVLRDEIARPLDALERKGFVRRESHSSVGGDDEYSFSHVLIRDVAYDQIPRLERAERHRRVAEWLSDRTDERAEQLAHHYWSALELSRAAGAHADHLVGPAVEHLTLAGERARALHAHRASIDYLERALGIAGDDAPAALPILESLGQSLQIVGRRDDAREVFERARAAAPASDVIRVARLHRLLAGSFVSDYWFADAHREYECAEATLLPVRNAERRREWIRVQTDRLTLLYWEQDTRTMNDVLDRVRPVVARWGTEAQRAEFLASHYLVRAIEERYVVSDETLDIGRRFVAAREALGDPVDIARARFNLGYLHLTRGELDEARPAFESALETADRTDNALLRSRSLTYLGVLHRRRRDLDATRSVAARALETATELRMPEYIGISRANLAAVALREGAVEQAETDAAAALAAFSESALASVPWEWLARFPLLKIALARGDVAGARRQARALLDERQQPLGAAIEAALAGRGRASLERAVALAEADGRV